MIAKVFGIEKLRFNTDGPGITTLVGMHGCPLNCEYCINNPIDFYYEYTIEELFKELFPHALYFEHSGGGVCFGGHEPLLQYKFIKEFIKYCESQNVNWKFGLETSLNAKLDLELMKSIDFLIIDIKDINKDIYKKYTEIDNKLVLKNLKIVKNFDNISITIRLPLIPGYNTREDIEKSKEYLRSIGYSDDEFDEFIYKTEI